MLDFQCCTGFRKSSPRILLQIPFCRANVRKKVLHVGIMLEQFALKVAWIPIDNHAAKIEHRCKTGSCHVVILANEKIKFRLADHLEPAMTSLDVYAEVG
jgi:hypothetical protein